MVRTSLHAVVLVLVSAGLGSGQDAAQKPSGGGSTSAPAPQMTAEQKAMMDAWEKAGAVGEPHRKLAQLAGQWDMTAKAWMEPGQPPAESKGTVASTMLLGGRVLKSQQNGTMMGRPFEGIGLTGYDNVTGRHWTTWMDSMSTGLFYAEGAFDAATNTYAYRGEMPDPTQPSRKLQVRAVTKVESPDRYVFEWYDDQSGKEMKSLEVTYTRRRK